MRVLPFYHPTFSANTPNLDSSSPSLLSAGRYGKPTHLISCLTQSISAPLWKCGANLCFVCFFRLQRATALSPYGDLDFMATLEAEYACDAVLLRPPTCPYLARLRLTKVRSKQAVTVRHKPPSVPDVALPSDVLPSSDPTVIRRCLKARTPGQVFDNLRVAAHRAPPSGSRAPQAAPSPPSRV